MRNDVLNILFKTKMMVLIMPEFIRQSYIDDLKCYIRQYLLEFNVADVGNLIDQMDCLGNDDINALFSESFQMYDFLKFDDLKNEHRKQFNDALRISLLLTDYEGNLEKQ